MEEQTQSQSDKDSNSDSSIFDDACSYDIATVDLETAFSDCETAIHKFFNNDVAGAIALMTPWAGTSLYHSLGVAIFEFIPAILSFEPNQIQRAITSIKTCVSICNKNRKHNTFVESIGSFLKKPNYATITDLEAHAELCYAEALLLKAALTIIEGEDLAGLFKASLKVKTCHNTYSHCLDITDQKTWESQESKDNFTSGVRLGTATFNLMISMLPPKIIAILEFVGFSGNKNYGLSELEKGSEAPGIRRVLCDLVLLGYHLVLCPFAGGEGDYNICGKILKNALAVYPQSVWFLVFKARLEFLQGNIKDAITVYSEISTAEVGVRQFHNLCYWELMWIHALILDYQKASNFADLLLQQSRWSKTSHAYMKAAIMIQADRDVDNIDTALVKCLLMDATKFKIKIAGKSLPIEKFILRRCARYHTQKCRLILPTYELVCIWNLLPLLRTNHKDILQNMLTIIELTSINVRSNPKQWMSGYEADNLALIEYLHGNVLAAMGLPRQAIEKFKDVLKHEKSIKEDTFIIPYTVCDMAMCYFELEDYKMTVELLSNARKKYSGYSLESRLHFRIHSRLQVVNQIIEKC